MVDVSLAALTLGPMLSYHLIPHLIPCSQGTQLPILFLSCPGTSGQIYNTSVKESGMDPWPGSLAVSTVF